MKSRIPSIYSPAKVAARVAQMGRMISRDYAGHTVDVVIILENAFIFGADLVRRISLPVVCHFVRSQWRDVNLGGYPRREVFFSQHPNLKGRHVLLVDAVLHSGVTQDFLLKRLLESAPRSLRLAVLVDKPEERKVDVKPDYFGFVSASKRLVGYGLPAQDELHRNLPYLGEARRRGHSPAGRRLRKVRKPARRGRKVR